MQLVVHPHPRSCCGTSDMPLERCDMRLSPGEAGPARWWWSLPECQSRGTPLL
jgi:hypothetical protein